jgi:hypothetical protein
MPTQLALAAYTDTELDDLAPSPYRTNGERLLWFLRRTVLADLHAHDLVGRLAVSSAAIEREHYFATALQDIVGFNVVSRLVLSARWAFQRLEGAALVENYVRSAVINELLIDYAEITPVFNYLMAAAQASVIGVSTSLRREVYDAHGLVCYACGVTLDRRSNDDKNSATIEHLWPQSLGGDSDFRNLLPACMACNSNRNEHADWPAFWFQSCFLGPRPSEEAIERAVSHRTRVALQFFRAYLVAADTGMSLKRSLLMAGPLPAPDVSERDFASDFFSIIAYEEKVQL